MWTEKLRQVSTLLLSIAGTVLKEWLATGFVGNLFAEPFMAETLQLMAPGGENENMDFDDIIVLEWVGAMLDVLHFVRPQDDVPLSQATEHRVELVLNVSEAWRKFAKTGDAIGAMRAWVAPWLRSCNMDVIEVAQRRQGKVQMAYDTLDTAIDVKKSVCRFILGILGPGGTTARPVMRRWQRMKAMIPNEAADLIDLAGSLDRLEDAAGRLEPGGASGGLLDTTIVLDEAQQVCLTGKALVELRV